MLQDGINAIFDSETFKNYLRIMSQFHSYSANNVMLIQAPVPDCHACCWLQEVAGNGATGAEG